MANEVVKKEKSTLSTFMTMPKIKNKIVEMVGTVNAPRFISSVVSAVTANPVLANCTQPSIFNAALLGESLNLSPSPQLGQYYMVPYNNNKTGVVEAQFQMGYKGYIQLAVRSGQYKKINVLAIKKGELLKWDPLNEDIEVNLIDDENKREKAPTIGYYAMFEYSNGFKKAIYWSKEKMLNHADKYSQAFSVEERTKTIKGKKVKIVSFADYEAGNYDKKDEWLYSSFWYKDFDGMALKTMLRQLISKWGIMSVELQTAYTADSAVIKEVSADNIESEYIDANNEIEMNANVDEIGFDEVPDSDPNPDNVTLDEVVETNTSTDFAEQPDF